MINKVKRKISGMLSVFLIVTMLFTLMPQSVSAATLNLYEGAIYKGKTFVLKCSDPVSSWTSSNTNVCRVNQNGLVYGVGVGTCNIIATLYNGTRKGCRMTVRNTNFSNYITNQQMVVALNMIGAVETGGQVYGKRNYAAFEGPGYNSPTELSATAGAFQEYGDNLRQLLIRTRLELPFTFLKYDNANIVNDLTYAWTSSRPYRVYAGSAKAKAIVNIISRSPAAQLVQNFRCCELIESYLKHIRSLGVTNVQAALFLAECEHLGGASSVERVVRRATNKNNALALYKSLVLDQKDNTSIYQIGDAIYQTRHVRCYQWLVANIPATATLR